MRHPAVRKAALLSLAVALTLCHSPADAQSGTAQSGTAQPVGVPAAATPPSSPGTGGFFNRLASAETLLGDMGGLRPLLARYGMTLAVQETSEVLGNLTGGSRTGAAYDGATLMTLQLDTGQAGGWQGGLFNVSALLIHGSSVSATNLLSLQTASGIEADRTNRLWELWYQQAFGAGDRFDIRIGQQSLDQEFLVNPNGAYLVNTMFGWPMVPSADMPGGGPADPLSVLGVRVRYKLAAPVTLLAGVFNGSPSPAGNGLCCSGDPQVQNSSGTRFPLNGGVLAIAEAQFASPVAAPATPGGQPPTPASLYKIGAWFDSENFADLRNGNDGLSLANPAGNGTPLAHRGDWGLYATMDQMVWSDPADDARNVNIFARVIGAPQADRNLITFSLNAGLTVHEPLPHRNDDTLAIGMGYARVSGSAAALDRATATYTGAYVPVRGGETYLEVSYQYQATPWWQLQPDVQYVFNPGGGIANPNRPGTRVGDELVLGLRTVILF